MSDLLIPGSVWREKNSPAIDERFRATNRRLVEVTDPGGMYSTGSRVVGVSFWEELVDGAWVAGDWPGNRRRTAVLRRAFLKRFEHLSAPEVDR